MRAYGGADLLATDSTGIMVFRVHPDAHGQFATFLSSIRRAQKKAFAEGKEDVSIDGSLSFAAELLETEKGGKLVLKTKSLNLDLEKKYNLHTRASQNTFFGVVRFITWAQIGYKPKSTDIYWDAEEIIERFAPVMKHPVSGDMRPVRPGDPRLTTKGMSQLIEGALNTLVQQDIPEEVMDAIGPDMKKLWVSWYDWRYNKEDDLLFEDEKSISWEEYTYRYPVCEFTGTGDMEGDPLIRMHIVSGGADTGDYEESWNWIHAHNSIHIGVQHQHGWGEIFKMYPHMKGKIERARKIAMKRGLL